MGKSPGDLLDFSANINPLGPPRSVGKRLQDCTETINCYPDPEYLRLREDIARLHDVPLECISAGNGASEILYLLAQVLSPEKILVLAPTFSEYEKAVKAHNPESTVQRLHLSKEAEFRLTDSLIEKVKDAVGREKIDCIFLCRPNSPTGTKIMLDVVEELAQVVSGTGTHMVIDESFLPFTQDWPENSAVKLTRRFPNIVVVTSLTKIFSIPGLRIGYLVGQTKLLRQMEEKQPPWAVNMMAACAARTGLADSGFVMDTQQWLPEVRKSLSQSLDSLCGIRTFPSEANFLLLELSDPCSPESAGKRLQSRLLQQGIMVRNCCTYPGLDENFIRVAVRKKEDNCELVRAISKIGL